MYLNTFTERISSRDIPRKTTSPRSVNVNEERIN